MRFDTCSTINHRVLDNEGRPYPGQPVTHMTLYQSMKMQRTIQRQKWRIKLSRQWNTTVLLQQCIYRIDAHLLKRRRLAQHATIANSSHSSIPGRSSRLMVVGGIRNMNRHFYCVILTAIKTGPRQVMGRVLAFYDRDYSPLLLSGFCLILV